MNPRTESTPVTAPPRRKPRLAFAIATVFGVGYMPKAPGTFGSIVGVGLAVLLVRLGSYLWLTLDSGAVPGFRNQPSPSLAFHLMPMTVLLVIAGIGVWSASRVAAHAGIEDPQFVVIDEVSGQHLTLLLALAPIALPIHVIHGSESTVYAIYFALSLLNWKYLLAGFILFRVFDIWKPYPIRLLEKLPGGWGIMADDWMAGVYAAIVLRLALHLGLI
jgi:phosphatidylglycerophosphatase A